MQVVQFFPGQGASGTGAGQGDPSMTVLTPAEQYVPGGTFATPPGVTDASVQLTWDSAAVTSVFVDGVPVTAFEGIGGSTFRLANLAVSNGTHVVTTDVWASMGHESETDARCAAFTGYGVDEKLMTLARPEAIFLHCLPAHRGEEVSDAVLEGPQSRVWLEAENRLHIQKALLATLMGSHTR